MIIESWSDCCILFFKALFGYSGMWVFTRCPWDTYENKKYLGMPRGRSIRTVSPRPTQCTHPEEETKHNESHTRHMPAENALKTTIRADRVGGMIRRRWIKSKNWLIRRPIGSAFRVPCVLLNLWTSELSFLLNLRTFFPSYPPNLLSF